MITPGAQAEAHVDAPAIRIEATVDQYTDGGARKEDFHMQNETVEAFREIDAEVSQSGGVVCTSMLRLRDAYGAGKLGSIVRSSISSALAGHGLGHIPEELPDSQHNYVLIYRLGSPIGEIVNALNNPSEASAEKLRDRLAESATSKLKRIREILEES